MGDVCGRVVRLLISAVVSLAVMFLVSLVLVALFSWIGFLTGVAIDSTFVALGCGITAIVAGIAGFLFVWEVI